MSKIISINNCGKHLKKNIFERLEKIQKEGKDHYSYRHESQKVKVNVCLKLVKGQIQVTKSYDSCLGIPKANDVYIVVLENPIKKLAA